MTPGTYLRKRREAAGLGVRQAAANLAASPWAIRKATPDEVGRLMQRITAAEEDRDPFATDVACLVRNAFHFDIDVYAQLLDLHQAGPHCGLPVPPVCRGCACSCKDACLDDRGPCAWVEQPSAKADGLCTACVRKMDLTAELGGASRIYELHGLWFTPPTPQVPA